MWMFLFSIILFAACAFTIIKYIFSFNEEEVTHALLLAIVGIMALIASNMGNSHQFLFSSAFWVNTNFLFYIVLKTLSVSGDIPVVPLQMALISSLLFLFGYFFGQLMWPYRPLVKYVLPEKMETTQNLYIWLLFSFFIFKVLNVILLMTVSGGSTALDFAQATQNLGGSYLFMLPKLATASYFIIILISYKHGLYRHTAIVLTVYIAAEAILGAARFTLVSTILIHIFLYHLYVHPIRFLYFIFLIPPLVFIIAFFGLVRDIEIGSLKVYVETLNVLVEERELVFKVFMGRMDMLPQMADAFELARVGQLKFEAGMSYIYAVLHAVPRNLWPDKPPLTAAYITELVNPYVFADGVNVYPSAMLEGYMNFGWMGVILIGIVLAWLSRFYDRALRGGTLRTQALALMAFTFPMQLINEGMHSNIFGILLYIAAIFGVWMMAGRLIMGRAVAKRLACP
jgi:hypothetical protein